jgi:hypothetical protein
MSNLIEEAIINNTYKFSKSSGAAFAVRNQHGYECFYQFYYFSDLLFVLPLSYRGPDQLYEIIWRKQH